MRAFHEYRNYNSSFSFSAMRLDNFNFLAHWHQDIELVYVCEGSLRMGINSESRVLEQGDLAICGSGDIHYFDSMGGCSSIILVIFNPRLIGSPSGWPLDIELRSNFVTRSHNDEEENDLIRTRTSQLMKELLVEENQRSKHYETFVIGMLYELCGLLMRHWAGHSTSTRSCSRRLANNRIMQELLDYLDANYTRAITLDDAARLAHMSTFYFSRYFKSAAGMSYIEYLNQLRARHAEHLVLHTDMKMIDIALESGFTNVRTFNRVFKQVKGIKPSDLR